MQPTLQVWLKRRASPKKLRTALKRSGRVRAVGAKRAKANREYSKKRKAYLAQNPYCEVVGGEPGFACKIHACDIHHIHGRLGGNLLNEDTWLPVCRPCHNWIHAHPKEARAQGLLA